MMPLALLLILLTSGPPSSLDCVGAHPKRNEAAIRITALLNREIERGYLNRAELGAVRALTTRRARLLECAPETDL